MQITIPQIEIETAIRDYILNQVSVKDDMEIDIDLRATRGAEGFQAIIDIHPRGSGGNSKPTSPKGGNSSKAKPLKIEKAVAEAKSGKASKNDTKSTKAEAAEAAEPTPAPEEPKTEAKTEATEAPIEAKAEKAEPKTEDEAPAKVTSIFPAKKDEPATDAANQQPPAETKSLFGGLKRPVNA